MWLISQYGVSEVISMKTAVFLRCIKLSGWFYCISILYSSVSLVQPFKTAEMCLWSARYSKMHFSLLVSAHTKLFIFSASSFFSKPSTKMDDVGKLLWAQMPLHSHCVSTSVPLIARKRCLCVSSTLRICVHCRTLSYIAPPFPVMPKFICTSTIIRSFHLQLCACLLN